MTQDDINNTEWATRSNWSPLTYRSPRDTRVWVPKRIGSGRTLNLGHPKGKAIFAMLVSMPLFISAIALLLHHRK